jgi:hypothetical protein
MGLLSNLGLKPSQASQADKAKADALKAQFGKDFKSAVVQATRLRDQKAKADMAKELQVADADLRKANAIRNPTQRAQAMQAALDKLNASAKKAKESQDAEKPKAPAQESEQAAKAKPNGKDSEGTQNAEPKQKPAENKPSKTKDGIDKIADKIREARMVRVKAMQAQMTGAKNKAVGRGNQLYKLFHADESNTKAGEAHNRGMAKLKSGDANAAKVTPENPDFEAAGAAAIEDYNAASEAFGEGLTMCGQAVKPQSAEAPAKPADKPKVGEAADGKPKTGAKTPQPDSPQAPKAPQAEDPNAAKGPIDKSGIGTSTAKIIKERIARAKALQAEAAAAKSTAVARGNQLYKLFHANESNTGAGQAHNRGMAKLKSGDANAAKIKPELDFEAAGAAAIQDYNAASEAFGEGLAMCGQPSKPLAKKEPEPAKEKPVAKDKDGKDKKDDPNNRTTTTIKTKVKDGAQITEVDKDSVSNKDGVLSESHTKEKQTIGPKGIELESKRQSQTVDKDGVTLESEDSSMVIDGKGKRATNKKAKLKVGNKSTTSSQETEVQATDGSRDIVASEVESGSTDDGGSVLVKKHSTTHVDPAGNAATVKATHKSVTGKDGKVSQSTSVTLEKKSAEEAAAEKKKVAEEKKKAEEAKQQREASAKALKAQAAAAKANAVGRGNRLYQLFHADESRKGAGQAHNRGMAKLASGDANAAKIKPEAEGFEAAGQAAIDDYQAAGQAFDEGIVMCGGAVKPAQVVPASGGM